MAAPYKPHVTVRASKIHGETKRGRFSADKQNRGWQVRVVHREPVIVSLRDAVGSRIFRVVLERPEILTLDIHALVSACVFGRDIGLPSVAQTCAFTKLAAQGTILVGGLDELVSFGSPCWILPVACDIHGVFLPKVTTLTGIIVHIDRFSLALPDRILRES